MLGQGSRNAAVDMQCIATQASYMCTDSACNHWISFTASHVRSNLQQREGTQTDRQTDRQTDTHTHTHTHRVRSLRHPTIAHHSTVGNQGKTCPGHVAFMLRIWAWRGGRDGGGCLSLLGQHTRSLYATTAVQNCQSMSVLLFADLLVCVAHTFSPWWPILPP